MFHNTTLEPFTAEYACEGAFEPEIKTIQRNIITPNGERSATFTTLQEPVKCLHDRSCVLNALRSVDDRFYGYCFVGPMGIYDLQMLAQHFGVEFQLYNAADNCKLCCEIRLPKMRLDILRRIDRYIMLVDIQGQHVLGACHMGGLARMKSDRLETWAAQRSFQLAATEGGENLNRLLATLLQRMDRIEIVQRTQQRAEAEPLLNNSTFTTTSGRAGSQNTTQQSYTPPVPSSEHWLPRSATNLHSQNLGFEANQVRDANCFARSYNDWAEVNARSHIVQETPASIADLQFHAEAQNVCFILCDTNQPEHMAPVVLAVVAPRRVSRSTVILRVDCDQRLTHANCVRNWNAAHRPPALSTFSRIPSQLATEWGVSDWCEHHINDILDEILEGLSDSADYAEWCARRDLAHEDHSVHDAEAEFAREELQVADYLHGSADYDMTFDAEVAMTSELSIDSSEDSSNEAAPVSRILRGARRVLRDPRTRALASAAAQTALGSRYQGAARMYNLARSARQVQSQYAPIRRARYYDDDEDIGVMFGKRVITQTGKNSLRVTRTAKPTQMQPKSKLPGDLNGLFAKMMPPQKTLMNSGTLALRAPQPTPFLPQRQPTLVSQQTGRLFSRQSAPTLRTSTNSQGREAREASQATRVQRPLPKGNSAIATARAKSGGSFRSRDSKARDRRFTELRAAISMCYGHWDANRVDRLARKLTLSGESFDPNYAQVSYAVVEGQQVRNFSSSLMLDAEIQDELWTLIVERGWTNDLVIDSGSQSTYLPTPTSHVVKSSDVVCFVNGEKVSFVQCGEYRLWNRPWVHIGRDHLKYQGEYHKKPWTMLIHDRAGDFEVVLDSGSTVNVTSESPNAMLLKPVSVNHVKTNEVFVASELGFVCVGGLRDRVMAVTIMDAKHHLIFGANKNHVLPVVMRIETPDIVEECAMVSDDDGPDPTISIVGAGSVNDPIPDLYVENMDAALAPEHCKRPTASGMDFVVALKGEAVREPIGQAVTYAGTVKNMFGAMCLPNGRGIATLTTRKVGRYTMASARAFGEFLRSDSFLNDGSRVVFGPSSFYSAAIAVGQTPWCFIPARTGYNNQNNVYMGLTPLRDTSGGNVLNNSEPTSTGNVQRCGSTPLGIYTQNTTDNVFIEFGVSWRQIAADNIAIIIASWYLLADGSYSKITTGSSIGTGTTLNGSSSGVLSQGAPPTGIYLGSEIVLNCLVASGAYFTVDYVRAVLYIGTTEANLVAAAPFQAWSGDIVPSLSQVQTGDGTVLAGRWTATRLFVSNTTASGFSSGNSVSLVCPYGDPFLWCGVSTTIAERIPGTKSRPITEGANLVGDHSGFISVGGWDAAFDEVPKTNQSQTCIFLAELPNIVNGNPSLRYAFTFNFEAISSTQALSPAPTVYSARQYEQVSALFTDGAVNSSNPKHKAAMQKRIKQAMLLLSRQLKVSIDTTNNRKRR